MQLEFPRSSGSDHSAREREAMEGSFPNEDGTCLKCGEDMRMMRYIPFDYKGTQAIAKESVSLPKILVSRRVLGT